jgi:hypothetical protein
LLAVEAIKRNRIAGSLDMIVANKGNLCFECLWAREDTHEVRLCIFAVDIYDWKDLGSHNSETPARGCAGIYMLPDRSIPESALRDTATRIAIPNRDVLERLCPLSSRGRLSRILLTGDAPQSPALTPDLGVCDRRRRFLRFIAIGALCTATQGYATQIFGAIAER